MAMGILGQLVTTTTTNEVVYTVPVGKIAVFNIFASNVTSTQYGEVRINGAIIGYLAMPAAPANSSMNISQNFKGIIGNAGTVVSFTNCTGIVTGYEEDA